MAHVVMEIIVIATDDLQRTFVSIIGWQRVRNKMWQSSEVDKGMTHIHEGFSIKPSCIDNDVHKGSLWAILNRSDVYDP